MKQPSFKHLVAALAKLRIGEFEDNKELLNEASAAFAKSGAHYHKQYVDGIMSGASQGP